MTSNEAVILHLSDIQFGAHHRFHGCAIPKKNNVVTNPRYGNNNAFKTLASKIEDDMQVLFKEKQLRPNILVVSGDLAEWSTKDEYKSVGIFINTLLQSDFADIERERVILVPGNHDINWDLSKAYFSECKAHRKRPEPPYRKKYFFWNQFLKHLGVNQCVKKTPWQGFNLSDTGILIIALDSCIQESHRTTDHYGWLGLRQTKEAISWLEGLDPTHEYIRIAVFHHNPLRYSNYDNENLRDWDELNPHFEKSVDIVLHGHRHENYRTTIGNLEGQKVKVLGAGSAGLDQEAMPSCPNQYQIIRLRGKEGCLYLRSYSEQTVGLSGKGQFRADADEKGHWEYPFIISSISPSMDTSVHRKTQLEHCEIQTLDDYVTSALSHISNRLLQEQEKVGEIIELYCIDIKTRETGTLDAVFWRWLGSDQSRMAILGSAGSGKTISCLDLCLKISQNNAVTSWIPLYIDLGRFSTYDDFFEILADCFRNQSMVISKQEVLDILKKKNLLLFLDAFDEYEAGGLIAASDRSFSGFQHLNKANVKIILTCRTNFFRCPEDIFIYELRTRDFDLCPPNSTVLELLPLEPSVVSSVLSQFISVECIPEWIFELADKPLHLRMLVHLVKMKVIDLSRSLKRHELYERFITYILSWDVARRPSATVTLDQSRSFHILLAERFLMRGSASLDNVELLHLIEKIFKCMSSTPFVRHEL